jgi:L-histidine N-alpha-methyltransferase
MGKGGERLKIERLVDPQSHDTLASDVLRGLTRKPKWLPSKHLYDERGGELFEQICALPEYYPTRTERALLELHAGDIVRLAKPSSMVELGSGSSRKTCVLLDALGRQGLSATYLPIDLDEAMLTASAKRLLALYPWLRIRGLVADLEQPLVGLPRGPGTLVAFLGGTIGNFAHEEAVGLLSGLAGAIGPEASLLLGTDMDKDPRRLEAAYDDSQGVTARFNLNLLQVLNRKLGADFDPARFRHLAFYDAARRQIEMHLRSLEDQSVRFERLGLTVFFRREERMRTEISRKLTADSGRRLLEEAGYQVIERFAAPGDDYSLWLAQVR